MERSLQTTPKTSLERSQQKHHTRFLVGMVLAIIVGLTAYLRFANLSQLGLANHYYTAAIKAMLQSWHNFFFVAAEPGGSVSVDKPPLGLWIQALSAWIFGISGFSVLLPGILAGIGSTVLIFHLVRRIFGDIAGLVAAAAVAFAPIAVATDRNNTMDSLLILTLLFAAWCYTKATETGKLKWLLWGGVSVGLGFNIKMLEAFLPLPAFYLMYLLGAKEKFGKKIWKISLSVLLLLLISLSWITVVDLTPAEQRPYVGSTTDNSEWSLAIGYNGMQRLLGMMGSRQGTPTGDGFGLPGNQPPTGGAFPGGTLPNFEGAIPPNFYPGSMPGGPDGNQLDGQNFATNFRPGDDRAQGGGMAGGMNVGQPGAFRLFQLPLSKDIAWLLPFALAALLLLSIVFKWHFPLQREHQALILWGGWLLTCVVFFSIAGFFHEYYLLTLVPAIAALVGIGVGILWQMRLEKPKLAVGLLLALVLATCIYQYLIVRSVLPAANWPWTALGLMGAGWLCALIAWLTHKPKLQLSALAILMMSILLIPAIWSYLTMQNASANQSLPAAYSGESAGGPGNFADTQVNASLLTYLQENTLGMRWMLAVPSSMQGTDYVIETGRGVLYLGGFSGQDPVLTVASLQTLLINNELRFIYTSNNGGGGGFGGNESNSTVSSWVQENCQVVSGFSNETTNAGAPDGTPQNNRGQFGINLYDCHGAAAK